MIEEPRGGPHAGASGLELRVPPLALAALCAIGIAVLPDLGILPGLAFPVRELVAIAAIVLGIAIAAAGVIEFRRSSTTVNPMNPGKSSSIVTSGVYRWSRNPMYLGMATALLGVAAWRASLPGYLLVPLFCALLDRFQIQPEERVLLARFGAEYSNYMAQVRRWI
jgi:protein-S-isoprenylcysteine O-methyltransferase Ste14